MQKITTGESLKRIPKQKIGLFGGTFDPVHNGHIALCLALKEAHNLSKVFFVPARKNPLKRAQCLDAEHRCNMLEIALKDVPDAFLLPIELDRKGLSFTIDTVQEILAIEPFSHSHLFLLMGEDVLESFHKWKDVHALIKLAQPLIASRTDAIPSGQWQKDPMLSNAIKKGFTKTSLFDISSTECRKRLKSKMYCGHLLNKEVLKYIAKHKLYQ